MKLCSVIEKHENDIAELTVLKMVIHCTSLASGCVHKYLI